MALLPLVGGGVGSIGRSGDAYAVKATPYGQSRSLPARVDSCLESVIIVVVVMAGLILLAVVVIAENNNGISSTDIKVKGVRA